MSARAAPLGAIMLVLSTAVACGGTTNNNNCPSTNGSSSTCTIINAGPASANPAGAPPPSSPLPQATSAPADAPTGEATTNGSLYLDDVARNCSIALTSGAATINGTPYAHSILQWAGDTSDTLTIARRATRFQAIVGLRDDASDRVQAKFELDGDNGRQLFTSRVLSIGDNESVDVPVDGVFRLTLRVKAVSSTWGYGGWGDARITSSSATGC
jgi:NPCBM/NEW2 domain